MTITRVFGSLVALALLSACATQPRIAAQVESQQYRSQAGRNYTPPGPPSDPWGPYIHEAAAKYDVPEKWIREVMRQESGGRMYGRSGDLITSGAGAMGLMQVMPGTYDELRARYSELGSDPFDPRNNIMAGTAYIREMYDIYGSPGFLAAYNAGPGRLDDYLTRNRTLPEETRRYVAAIGPRLSGAEPNRPSPGAQYAMNSMPMSIPAGSRYASTQRYAAPAGPIVLTPVPPPAFAPVAAPVQLAQAAPPRGNFIRLQPQPAWAPPADSAQGPYIMLQPAPVQVAQAPAPVAPPIQVAQLPEPPRPAAAPLPAQQFAQLPEPPRLPLRDAPHTQQQLAAAALVPLAPRGFALVTPAHAEPMLRGRGPAPVGGNWAVQVGAFANEGLAASAAASARDQARDVLGPARSSVTAVRQPRGTLYRARLNGLSREGASQACERLSRSRTTCMVVSPDAQS